MYTEVLLVIKHFSLVNLSFIFSLVGLKENFFLPPQKEEKRKGKKEIFFDFANVNKGS